MTRIGVLALQGDFAEHINVLSRIEVDPREVRLPKDLTGLDGLIIPGGESTTISRLMAEFGLLEPLRQMAADGFPIWGTCAGMIVLAKQASDLALPTIAAMDIEVERNAYGRQVDSFEADLSVPALGEAPFHAVFIRAPVVREVFPPAETLARLENGTPVIVREGKLLATSFHPELTEDTRLHRYFVEMAREGAKAPAGKR